MGFEEVYASLQQLFPQIDARALRAVSIEHSKDVDAAVVAVLEEIIPFFERSTLNSPLSQNVSISESSETDGNSSMRTQILAQVQNDDSVCARPSEPVYDSYDGNHVGEENTAELNLSVENFEDKMKLGANVHSQAGSLVVIDENRVETHKIEISAGPQIDGTVLADKCPERDTNISRGSIPQPLVGMLQDLDLGESQIMNCIQEKEDIADESVLDVSVHTSGSIVQLVETPDMDACNLYKSELSTDNATSGKNISNDLGCIEDESTLNAALSTQICITDVIDEVIADARNNKKTLFFEMESVINLMKLVEVKEQAVEQAKQEAATGGMDLLNQAEDLKRMLQHAKEANDMHAGEVYGEKAILATELRELQSRVRSLLEERDASLAILDEIRQSLEVRLSAAMNEIKTAELRKLEKEELAQKSLDEQKLIMEKVVEESKILRQQAEDNAKLEEFLLDRGRVVDTLQGEIAVICQDVKLLKERFDQHVPLGKSLFSNQTSFMLASLASSLKSMVPDQVETVVVGDGDQLDQVETVVVGDDDQLEIVVVGDGDQLDEVETVVIQESDQLETENNNDPEKVPEDEAARENCKSLLEDDGWEFFDSSEVIKA